MCATKQCQSLKKTFGLAAATALLLVGWSTATEAGSTSAYDPLSVRGRKSLVEADTIRKAREGAPVPRFKVSRLRDSTRTVTPSAFEGKYLLLNLWASWCAPCIEKLPALRTARKRYSTDSLAILNVSFDRSRSDARNFLENHSMPGRHAFVGISGLGGAFGAKFARLPGEEGMRGLPNITLVGPGGTVVEILPPSSEKSLLGALDAHLR